MLPKTIFPYDDRHGHRNLIISSNWRRKRKKKWCTEIPNWIVRQWVIKLIPHLLLCWCSGQTVSCQQIIILLSLNSISFDSSVELFGHSSKLFYRYADMSSNKNNLLVLSAWWRIWLIATLLFGWCFVFECLFFPSHFFSSLVNFYQYGYFFR